MGDSEDLETPKLDSHRRRLSLYNIITQLKETYGFDARDVGALYADLIASRPMAGYRIKHPRDTAQEARAHGRHFAKVQREFFYNTLFDMQNGQKTRENLIPNYEDLEGRLKEKRPFESMDRKVKNLQTAQPNDFFSTLGNAVINGAKKYEERWGTSIPDEEFRFHEYELIKDDIDRIRPRKHGNKT